MSLGAKGLILRSLALYCSAVARIQEKHKMFSEYFSECAHKEIHNLKVWTCQYISNCSWMEFKHVKNATECKHPNVQSWMWITRSAVLLQEFFVYLILGAFFIHWYQGRRSTCIICHCFAGFHRAWGMYKPKVAEADGDSKRTVFRDNNPFRQQNTEKKCWGF